ncbi:hypothetical protein ACFL1B_04845 [Nanoarchaeota archaeon]
MSEFFTTIKEPSEFRKQLLQASKGVLCMLKDLQDILETRQEKYSKIAEIQEDLGAIKGSLEHLGGFVPEDQLKELEAMLPKHEEEEFTEKGEAKAGRKRRKSKNEGFVPSHPATPEEKVEEKYTGDEDMQKINQALAEIEEKLSNFQ